MEQMKQMEKLENRETVAEKAARLLHAEVEHSGEKTILKRQRTLEILAENNQFTCTLELDISFEHLKEDGMAFNKAEIFLLPEEYPAFFLALSEHRLPLPTDYRQWQKANPNIVGFCMEATEPPEHFAERLSAALQLLDT